MQIVDFWIGVPICVALSLVHAVSLLFGAKGEAAPKKILFIELSEMGSSIIAYSALKKAAEKYGAENLYFLIFEKNRESVDLLKIIPRENVVTICDKNFVDFAIDAFGMLLKLRKLEIDTVIDMELFSRFTAIVSFLSGAKRRIGFNNYTSEGLYRGNFITHGVLYNAHQHMSLNFLALVDALEADTDELPLVKANMERDMLPLMQAEVAEELKAKVKERLAELCPAYSESSKLVIVNPDPGDALPIRGWPKDRFVEVSKRLLEADPKVLLVVMGLKSSKGWAVAIQAAVGKERCVDFTGETANLEEVLALFEVSDVLLSNDSGPAHIAALTSIHSVVMFGPETPALYGPLTDKASVLYSRLSCSPCLAAANHRHTICKNSRCLQAISVEEVYESVAKAL